MMLRTRHRSWFYSAVLLLIVLLSMHAEALVLQPWRTELSISPGQRYEGTLIVVNDQPRAVTMDVIFQDHSRTRELYPDWISWHTDELSLEAGATSVVSYIVDIPEYAEGEFYARVGFQERTISDPAAVSIRSRISVPIFVIADGTEHYEADIGSVIIKQSSPVEAEVVFENRGNVHVRPRGRCELSRDGSQPVCTMPINSQAFPVYPGSERALVARSNKSLPSGTYQATVRFDGAYEGQPMMETFEVILP